MIKGMLIWVLNYVLCFLIALNPTANSLNNQFQHSSLIKVRPCSGNNPQIVTADHDRGLVLSHAVTNAGPSNATGSPCSSSCDVSNSASGSEGKVGDGGTRIPILRCFS